MFEIPDEIKEKREKIKPYLDGCEIRDDAPEWAKKIDAEIKEWLGEMMDGVM